MENGDGRAFTAVVRGSRRPATVSALLTAAVRRPWSTAAVWAGIRRLLRGLPLHPRPRSVPQKGMLP
nr:hypothetical protein [Streptomyces sp. XY511]